MTAMPLTPAATAALKAELSVRHGRFSLNKSLIVNVLVNFLAGRGEGINDLAFDVDRDDEDAWEAEWRQIATSAGVNDPLDRDRLVYWLRARSRPANSAREATGTSNVAITALVKAHDKVSPRDQTVADQHKMQLDYIHKAHVQADITAAKSPSLGTHYTWRKLHAKPNRRDISGLLV